MRKAISMINKKIKEFHEQWDNRFLVKDLTNKLGMKERATAFVQRALEEQEKRLNNGCGKAIVLIGNKFKEYIQKQEKRLRLSKKEIAYTLYIEFRDEELDPDSYKSFQEMPKSFKEFWMVKAKVIVDLQNKENNEEK